MAWSFQRFNSNLYGLEFPKIFLFLGYRKPNKAIPLSCLSIIFIIMKYIHIVKILLKKSQQYFLSHQYQYSLLLVLLVALAS